MERVLRETSTTSWQDVDREMEFVEQDFQRIRSLVYGWAGISLNDSKRPLVYNRLTRRLRACGLARFCDYLDLVEESSQERESFINALTTNLTSFFREEHHFQFLSDHLKSIPKGKSINIWCAASSTGEEPYSIAMTVLDTLDQRDVRRVRILASDLDTRVLEHARAGIYREDQITKLPRAVLQRHFLRGDGRRSGFVKVKQALRDLVVFEQINLLDAEWSVQAPVDVVFCRNVMIYFDKPTQSKVLEKVAGVMASDGVLMVGHSESLSHASHLFRLRGRTLYVRSSQGSVRV